MPRRLFTCPGCQKRFQKKKRQMHAYCADCYPWHCRTCQQRMDAPRAGKRCKTCLHAAHVAKQLKTHCTTCGKKLEEGRTLPECTDCRREQYALTRRALLARGPRPCARCARMMPAGRKDNRCTACLRACRKAAPARQRPCAECGKGRRCQHSSYCKLCRYLKNWRTRKIHEGQFSGPVEPRQRWQQGDA